MGQKGWKYYNNAAIPSGAPHEVPDLSVIETGEVWHLFSSKPLLARWTTDYDCEEQTGWWYIVKDEPFDISKLKAKRRYVINKGLKNFKIEIINPLDNAKKLFEITVAATQSYPKKQRPKLNYESFKKNIESWTVHKVYGAFSIETGDLCGYALVGFYDAYIDFTSLKVIPEYEKQCINAALVCGILYDIEPLLQNGIYICDGARNINHTTAFQDYLESYFDFRKAYAKLHIEYNPKVRWIVKMAYPLRCLLKPFRFIKLVDKFVSVLKMEAIIREENF